MELRGVAITVHKSVGRFVWMSMLRGKSLRHDFRQLADEMLRLEQRALALRPARKRQHCFTIPAPRSALPSMMFNIFSSSGLL